jgi:uncharacterized membrane protein YfcA
MVILILLSLAVGFISSFFGVGGGVLMVPGLYLIYPDLPHQTIISTSMGVIFFNGLLNSYNFYLKGKVPQLKMIFYLSFGMVIGGQIGSRLTYLFDQQTAKKLFALILLLVILRTYFSKKKTQDPGKSKPAINVKVPQTLFTGFVAGLIAGLSGLGGGVVIVPALMIIYGLPFSWLSVYSNPAMAAGALSALLTFMTVGPSQSIKTNLDSFYHPFQWGYLNFALIAIIVFFSFLSSKLGTKLTDKVSPTTAKYSFLSLLTIIMFRMFLS